MEKIGEIGKMREMGKMRERIKFSAEP